MREKIKKKKTNNILRNYLNERWIKIFTSNISQSNLYIDENPPGSKRVMIMYKCIKILKIEN